VDTNSWQSRPRHARASNEVLRSATQAVCLQCSRHSHPIRNASTMIFAARLLDAKIRLSQTFLAITLASSSTMPSADCVESAERVQASAGCVEHTVGTRVPLSGLPRVFVYTLACISMQTPGGLCRSLRAGTMFSTVYPLSACPVLRMPVQHSLPSRSESTSPDIAGDCNCPVVHVQSQLSDESEIHASFIHRPLSHPLLSGPCCKSTKHKTAVCGFECDANSRASHRHHRAGIDRACHFSAEAEAF
jgi:hypothetical protein